MPATASVQSFRDRLLSKSGEATFRAGESSDAMKVDAVAGIIRGVSLLVANREALGWWMWIDAVTIARFSELLAGRKLKAYATHGTGYDGTLTEVGLWQDAKIDGDTLRADFSALDAFKEFSKKEFATLFELATKAPAEFGTSLKFRYTLAWVRQNGTDVPTEICDWNIDDDCPIFEPSAPADAVRMDIPSVRPVKVLSSDFVDEPAATDGLFRAGQVDAPGKGVSAASTAPLPPAPLMDIKTLQAEFGKNPAHLARVVALFSANEKLSVAELRATIAGEEQSAELATLRSGKSELEGQLATLKSAQQTATAEFGKLEAAGFKATSDKTSADLAIAEIARLKAEVSTKTTAIAELKAGGTGAVHTGEQAGAEGSKPALKGIARYEAGLKAKLTPQKPANN